MLVNTSNCNNIRSAPTDIVSLSPSSASTSASASGRLTGLAATIASKFRLFSSSNSSRDKFSMKNIERTRQDVIRNQMVDIIAMRLEQGTSKNDRDFYTPTDSSSSINNEELAKALENHLYRRAPNFKAYADKSTLNSRLRVLTLAVLRRRLKNKSKTTPKTMGENRLIAIKKSVGDTEKYSKICQLANKVRSLRLQHCATACGSCQKTGGVCPMASAQSERFVQAGSKIPPPVRNLFFDTPLLVALEKTPLDRISEFDWDESMKNTEQIIEAYQEWLSV